MGFDGIALVFDKDAPREGPAARPKQPLLALAGSLGLPRLDRGDQDNVTDRLLSAPQRVLLLHIDSKDWTRLLEGLSETRVAIRFSTDGFLPEGPQGRNRNGFLCQKRTIGELSADELGILVDTFADPKMVPILRGGLVPPKLRTLIRFIEPQQLHALYLLIQADLSSRATPSGPSEASENPQGPVDPRQLVSGRFDLVLTASDYRRVVQLAAEAADVLAAAASELSMSVKDFTTHYRDTTALLAWAATASGAEVSSPQVLSGAFHELQGALKTLRH